MKKHHYEMKAKTKAKAIKGLSISLLSLVLFACSPKTEQAPTITRIIDGDTVEITQPNGEVVEHEIPFIDAPEREQPFGRDATKQLKQKVLNQTVEINEQGELTVDNVNVGMWLVESGHAWHIPDHARFEALYPYSVAQENAVNNLAGIWGLAHELRVPPWTWRAQSKQRSYQSTLRKRKNNMRANAKIFAPQRPSGYAVPENQKNTEESQEEISDDNNKQDPPNE